MTEKPKSKGVNKAPADVVKGKLKVSHTGVQMEGQVPAATLHGLGTSLKKMAQGTFAAIAPERFERAMQVLARGELLSALTASLADKAQDADAAHLLAVLLNENAQDVVERFGRRQEIVRLALEEVQLADSAQSVENPISQEFASFFWNAADRATTADVRELFAKILAKESIAPGSYSASTLNLLAILPPALARTFESLCRMSFGFNGFNFVVISSVDAQSPATKENSVGITRKNGEQLLEFGIDPQDLLDMRAAALTRSLPGEEYPNLQGFFAQHSVELAGRRMRMELLEGAPKEPGFSVSDATNVISLTRAGSELRTLLSLEPNPEYEARIVRTFANARIRLQRET